MTRCWFKAVKRSGYWRTIPGSFCLSRDVCQLERDLARGKAVPQLDLVLSGAVVLGVPESFQSAHEGGYMRKLGSAVTLALSLAAVASSGARADTFDFSGTVVTYTIPTTGVYEIVA